jgi:hypothetical protein
MKVPWREGADPIDNYAHAGMQEIVIVEFYGRHGSAISRSERLEDVNGLGRELQRK